MKKLICLLLLIVAAIALAWVNATIPKQGYYLYKVKDANHATAYYFQNGSWFRCEEDADWAQEETVSQELHDQWKTYYLGLVYPHNYPAPDFAETAFYADHVKQNVYDSEK